MRLGRKGARRICRNMSVGDTHTIQALNSASLPVTGLTWVSSNPDVVEEIRGRTGRNQSN